MAKVSFRWFIGRLTSQAPAVGDGALDQVTVTLPYLKSRPGNSMVVPQWDPVTSTGTALASRAWRTLGLELHDLMGVEPVTLSLDRHKEALLRLRDELMLAGLLRAAPLSSKWGGPYYARFSTHEGLNVALYLRRADLGAVRAAVRLRRAGQS